MSTTKEALDRFYTEGAAYQPYFKAVDAPKGDLVAGCFYRACQAYCGELLGVTLDKEPFDALVRQRGLTLLLDAFTVLDEALQPFGFGVLKIFVLEHPDRECFTGAERSPLEPFDYRVITSSVRELPKVPSVVFIRSDTVPWMPANHFDAATTEFKLIEISYASIIIG